MLLVPAEHKSQDQRGASSICAPKEIAGFVNALVKRLVNTLHAICGSTHSHKRQKTLERSSKNKVDTARRKAAEGNGRASSNKVVIRDRLSAYRTEYGLHHAHVTRQPQGPYVIPNAAVDYF